MPETKRITFTVINDLIYDQRMQRICNSLATAGFDVTLIGRKGKNTLPFSDLQFKQKRLNCWFSQGKAMYLEFNLRLFFYLLFQKANCICAIDLDTIMPVYFASTIRGKQRVYDAHELFTEQKEIVTRPIIQKVWLKVEQFAVPKFPKGYTVNQFIADELHRRYGVNYSIVRNLPTLKPLVTAAQRSERFIIYQGAVNEGRSFETLIPAMKQVEAKLVICGNGNYFNQCLELIKEYAVSDKVIMKGYVKPDELATITPTAYIAVMLFENTGLNQYYSLANRFFDYIMAGVPQVCVAYPEYVNINNKYEVAYLIPDTAPDTITTAINKLLNDDALYHKLRENCLQARKELNWQNEEKVLIDFYQQLLN